MIEIKASKGLKDHVGGQWAIHYPCMRSLWFMVISIYMVIIQSCIPAYIGITRWQWDRKRRKMIEENEFKAEIFLGCKWPYRRDHLWPISVSFPFSFSFPSFFIILIMVLLFLVGLDEYILPMIALPILIITACETRVRLFFIFFFSLLFFLSF